jgi:hypothetical protein
MSTPVIYPVLERITLDLLNTMKSVTTVAGYRQTLDVVRENPEEGHTPRDNLAVLHKADYDAARAPANAIGYKQHYSVSIFIFEDSETDVPVDQRLTFAVADLTKVLNADYRRSNDAVDTTCGPPVPADPMHGAIVGGTFRVTVYYRTVIDDPYTSV